MRIERADSEAELLGPPISNREIVKVVAGDFEVRVAKTAAEIDAAQALRYRIFYEEMARAQAAIRSAQSVRAKEQAQRDELTPFLPTSDPDRVVARES